MKRVLAQALPEPGKPALLNETEANHATQVLRLRDGDRVEALDGKGNAIEAILRSKGGPVRIEHAGESTRRASESEVLPIVLEMAVLKGDAMEWVIEKAVELGVRRVDPLLTDHTVVQIDKKGPEAFKQRWQKIADQALKQCGRLEKLEITSPRPLTEVLGATPRIWCVEPRAEGAELPLLQDVLSHNPPPIRLLIGPEGGWSQNEIRLLEKSGAIQATLGPLTLRAETAALLAISLVSGHLRSASRGGSP